MFLFKSTFTLAIKLREHDTKYVILFDLLELDLHYRKAV